MPTSLSLYPFCKTVFQHFTFCPRRRLIGRNWTQLTAWSHIQLKAASMKSRNSCFHSRWSVLSITVALWSKPRACTALIVVSSLRRCHLFESVCLLLSHGQLFVAPWTVARQAPLSTGSSRQEYWSGWPFLSPGDLPDPRNLPDPGIKPRSPALLADSLPSETSGKPCYLSTSKPPNCCYLRPFVPSYVFYL